MKKEVWKSIIFVGIILIIVCFLAPIVASRAEITPTEEATISTAESTTTVAETPTINLEDEVRSYFKEIGFIEPIDENDYNNQITNCKDYLLELDKLLKDKTYKKVYSIIIEEKNYVNSLIAQYDEWYERYLDDLKWEARREEYPYATEIWLYMKNELGWNDYVCAGVLGNMMAEVGGQTLNIQYWLYNSTKYYYGICQWNAGSYKKIHGAGLEEQLDFLAETVQYEINTFGYAYKKGFNYEQFILLEDAKAAALAFAKSYERCSSASYSIRQANAIKAYEYFVN